MKDDLLDKIEVMIRNRTEFELDLHGTHFEFPGVSIDEDMTRIEDLLADERRHEGEIIFRERKPPAPER